MRTESVSVEGRYSSGHGPSVRRIRNGDSEVAFSGALLSASVRVSRQESSSPDAHETLILSGSTASEVHDAAVSLVRNRYASIVWSLRVVRSMEMEEEEDVTLRYS